MAYVIYVDDENDPVNVQHAFFGQTEDEAREALEAHRKQDPALDRAIKAGAEQLATEIDDQDRPGSAGLDDEDDDEEEDEEVEEER